jgi:hypothetical protein
VPELINHLTDAAISDREIAYAFNKRGLFVGGCPKSGTTLLISLLDNHPQLIVLPEETFYLEKWPQNRVLNNFEAKLSNLLENTDLCILALNHFEPQRDCESADARHYANFDYHRFVELAKKAAGQLWMNDSLLFSEMVRAYGAVLGVDWQNCVRWVEKSTSNEVRKRELDALFPDAKVIQMLRDPRAVFASRKSRQVKHGGSYTKAHRLLREWNRSSREIPRLRREPSRFLIIRYEDLTLNPRGLLETICQFGGFEFCNSMLEPTRAGNDWEGNSAFHKSFKGISTASVDQWKDTLTEHEIWWVELHCKKGMKLANYPLQTDARFSLSRWLKRLPRESLGGYLRARRASICQWLGWLRECRYDEA